MMNNTDEFFMRKALSLAKRAQGKTCPNPLVGAVIVRDGEIIGEGYHHRAGLPHAEIEAMNSVKDRSLLKGSTMYVNLEPCNHYGKTPPCSLAIVQAGIKRVVIGMRDLNPEASGGIEYLRKHGVEVLVGVLEDEAKRLNEVFIENITKKKPFFIMKAAMLLNGIIALRGGVSKWITSDESRKLAHRLRGIYGAVAVGINTVLMDDPLLTCRVGRYKQPKRLIFDMNLKVPISARLFGVHSNNVYVVTSQNVEESRKKVLRAMDINLIECQVKNNEFDPEDLCNKLLENEICSVLVEGGSRTHGYFLKHNLYNKAYLFYSPRIAGSYGAFNAVGCDAPGDFSSVSSLKEVKCKRVGNDILIEGYF